VKPQAVHRNETAAGVESAISQLVYRPAPSGSSPRGSRLAIGRGARRQTHLGARCHRKLTVLTDGSLCDLRIVAAVLSEPSSHLALDVERVADRIVPADLHLVVLQKALVPNPVRQLVGYPGTALRSVVVRRRRADQPGELVFPMDPFRHVGNAEAIRDAGRAGRNATSR
jgi:hypothetical protein